MLAPASGSRPTLAEAELAHSSKLKFGGLSLLLTAFVALSLVARAQPVSAATFAACLVAAWLGFGLFFSDGNPVSAPLARLCLIVAVAVRIAGLATPPIFEDDWARYLWDGHRFLKDGTPYASAPADYLGDADVDDGWRAVLDKVNNPDVPTIYGPSLQYVFALTSWLAPASLIGLKTILVIFDLGLWMILWRLGGVAAGLRYALCPLVVFEVAFNAHADIIGASLAVASYALVRARHEVAGGAALGLALACKPFAVIVGPALLNRRWPVVAATAAGVLVGLYAPFVWKGATEYAGLEVFSRWWEFNSLGFAAIKLVLDDSIARPLALVLGVSLGASLMFHWRLREADTSPPADLWLLALLLFAPVINPWYLLWAVPWACLRPATLTWSVLPAVSVSYLTAGVLGIGGQGFHDHPVWVRPLEVGLATVVFLCLSYSGRAVCHRPPWRS